VRDHPYDPDFESEDGSSWEQLVETFLIWVFLPGEVVHDHKAIWIFS